MTTTQIVRTCLLLCATFSLKASENRFSVASFNLENYLVHPHGNREAKPPESRLGVRKSLLAIHPDIVALQEVGDLESLQELQSALSREGLPLPHLEHVEGSDTNILIAILSRFPIVSRHPHTNESYLLDGRRFRMSRGIAEVEIAVTPSYRFTLLAAHLKSKRPVAEADETEMREQEALRLRTHIDRLLRRDPRMNLLVCGDFNDSKDSKTVRALIGTSEPRLLDTRPEELTGERPPSSLPRAAGRTVAWTHYYAKEDTYSRFDYILLNRGMAREWTREGTYVLALPGWGEASDHRPVVASFVAEER